MAKEYFKNAQTWKQISTNVPHEMYNALRSRVTKDISMSKLLRDIITESDFMREGNLPSPCWSVELTQHVVALRAEVAAEKQVRENVEKALFELRREIVELKQNAVSLPENTISQVSEPNEIPILSVLPVMLAEESTEAQPEKERVKMWPIILGRLTEMFGGTQKTA
ncbi:MAG: hypothetical protein C0473_01275 [Cyanobacteria bacterium DS3.002]|nr:hypothetical protein [Cyanobacteria bacterium DS3.002]MBA4073458.1 hypothetical protein [Cyanobacteria bacterium PR.023]